jgi:hypothetical protein
VRESTSELPGYKEGLAVPDSCGDSAESDPL